MQTDISVESYLPEAAVTLQTGKGKVKSNTTFCSAFVLFICIIPFVLPHS